MPKIKVTVECEMTVRFTQVKEIEFVDEDDYEDKKSEFTGQIGHSIANGHYKLLDDVDTYHMEENDFDVTEEELNTCTFCGKERYEETIVCEGYITLDSCNGCREEIPNREGM